MAIQESASPSPSRTAGFFAGAVAPTLLCALGGALVLRGGRVVGEAGAGGAIATWIVATALTACTAASLSAILTNARPDATSTMSAIRGSLGRGVGAFVGVPMWLARVFGASLAALAVVESTEGLSAAGVLVALVVLSLAGVAAWQVAAAPPEGGPWLARAAPAVLAVVALGLAAMVSGATASPPGRWWMPANYGALLAFVVPVVAAPWVAPDTVASTGEVRRPSPLWWSLGIGWMIQLAVLAWFGQLAPAATLALDPRIGLDSAAIPLVARIGLVVGAAFAAVAALHDGSRLAREVVGDAVPSLERPGIAELATTVAALATVVAVRDLDGAAIATTLALLFAFTAIDTVVAIELVLGLSSFRPSIKLSRAVPIAGALGCAIAMVLTHPVGAIALSAAVLAGVVYLLRPGRHGREHSALFAAVGERMARRTSARLAVRAWKPSLVVPVADGDEVRPALDLLADLVLPEGSVRLLGTRADVAADVDRLTDALAARGIDAAGATVDAVDDPTPVALEALQLALFRPNLLAVRLSTDGATDARLLAQVAAARKTKVGAVILGTPPNVPVVGARRTITLWIRGITGQWDPLDGYEGRNLDLTLLLGWRLARRWGSQLRLVTVVSEPGHRLHAEQFLQSLCSLARLPPDTVRLGIVGAFEQAVDDLSNSDLDVFGLQAEPDLARLRGLVGKARSTCLFVLDSGRESALV